MGLRDYFKKRWKNKKEIFLDTVGALFFLWGVLAIVNSLYILNPNQIFWNCYISLLLLGIGLFMRSSLLIGSQIAILGLPLLMWDIDFIYHLVVGEQLFGITKYFFLDKQVTLGKIISLQHLFTVPLAIYSMFLIKVKNWEFWKISVVQVTLSYIVISTRTTAAENISCVFSPCINVSLGLPYGLTWFIIFFGLIFITNGLMYLFMRKKWF